jgi:hypothetical protein
MEFISLLLRLPFFLIHFLLLSLVVMVAGGLVVVLWYGLLFPLWFVIGIPFTIISSTFSNEHKFSDYVEGLKVTFWYTPIDIITVIIDHYASLFMWLFKG